MNREEEDIVNKAAEWHVASARDYMDWDSFTAWLESDPRHRRAYDEIALTDAMLDEHRAKLSAIPDVANDDWPAEGSPAKKRHWFGRSSIAIAASLAALLFVPRFLQPQAVVYRTAGASRTITLGDGSHILIAPHSRLEIEGGSGQRISLRGGAWFDIVHHTSRPLTISAGRVAITDIGTRFDVQAVAGTVRVAVADGQVEIGSDALSLPIRLARNRALLFDGAGGTAVVSPIQDDSIGGWRKGRLSYEATPLALVAADLTRYAGLQISVADALRERNFSGTLVIGDGKAALRDLSQLMDAELRSTAHGYRLEQRDH